MARKSFLLTLLINIGLQRRFARTRRRWFLLIAGLFALCGAEAVRRFKGFCWTLPEARKTVVPNVQKKLALVGRPKWGSGLDKFTLGEWRPYLPQGRDARETLQEMCSLLNIAGPDKLGIENVVEGVRRMMMFQKWKLVESSDKYWTHSQAASIANALVLDAGLSIQAQSAEMDPQPKLLSVVATPWPFRFLQRTISQVSRISLHILGFQSRFEECLGGRLHIYDSGAVENDEPPLVLIHGLFVLGYSMGLLAVLLRPRRRVVIVDLLDFDFSMSMSRGRAVCSARQHASAIQAALDDLFPDALVDLCGHSFGGLITLQIAANASSQARAHCGGCVIRKAVVLAPAGALMSRLFASNVNPDNVSQELAWLPSPIRRLVAYSATSIICSAGNLSQLFGNDYEDLLVRGRIECPLLVIWGSSDAVNVPRRASVLRRVLALRAPQSQVAMITGGSHGIILDSVVTVAKLMDSFLSTKTKNCVGVVEGWATGRPGKGMTFSLDSFVSTLLCFTDRQVQCI